MTKRRVLIVVEHLEKKLYPWLYYEYKHAAQLIGRENFMITNVCNEEEARILKEFAEVTCKSSAELYEDPIVLDPQALELLRPDDAALSEAAVVGGILGDHPPRGRTSVLLTSKFKRPRARSLGPKQLSIDGAAVVAHIVLNEGVPLEAIEFVDGVSLKRVVGGVEHIVSLPYRYPVLGGKPAISEELVEYVLGAPREPRKSSVGRRHYI